jgi:hypothetical protein
MVGGEARWRPRRHAPDYALLAVVAVLVVLGLIAVYSSSYALGYAEYGDANFFIKRQAVAALIGLAGLVVAMNIDYRPLVRLSPLPQRRSVSLFAADGDVAALERATKWLATPGLTALEYLNRHAAAAIGWEVRPHLLAEFDGDTGDITDPGEIGAVWQARDDLYPVLAGAGHPVIEDPKLDAGGLSVLLPWLDTEGIPAFGHLGVGIVHPCLRPDDDRVATLYRQVADLGGEVSGEHGIGLKKKAWTTESYRTRIRRLKDAYDPDRVVNRGKLC